MLERAIELLQQKEDNEAYSQKIKKGPGKSIENFIKYKGSWG